MNRLLAFYYGSHPDHRGRMLAEILKQDDLWLELTHDYIQWLFPLTELSRASTNAPLLDKATIETFRSDELLRKHLRATFIRMLAFFGLTVTPGGVQKAASWNMRKGEWFQENTHNSLRITRMLKSIGLLGLEWEARALHTALLTLCETEPDCGISADARMFWREAVARD
jgi:Opioid growth factor receptor (OGFr) conserved region